MWIDVEDNVVVKLKIDEKFEVDVKLKIDEKLEVWWGCEEFGCWDLKWFE